MNFYLETDSSCGPKNVGVAVAATQAGRDSTAMIPRRQTHSNRRHLPVSRHSGIAAFHNPQSTIHHPINFVILSKKCFMNRKFNAQ